MTLYDTKGHAHVRTSIRDVLTQALLEVTVKLPDAKGRINKGAARLVVASIVGAPPKVWLPKFAQGA